MLHENTSVFALVEYWVWYTIALICIIRPAIVSQTLHICCVLVWQDGQ